MVPSQESKTESDVYQNGRMLQQVRPYRHTLRMSEYVQGIPSRPCSGTFSITKQLPTKKFKQISNIKKAYGKAAVGAKHTASQYHKW